MLSLFRRKRLPPGPSSMPQEPIAKGLLRPEPPSALLATPRRQRLLTQIWQRTAVSREQFGRLYRAPLERYAALVQHFPASEAHHHAYPGGMLDHGLEIVAIALKLRQAHLLPAGAPPETQAAEAEAWTAGVAYAALLHDIGKIAVDIHVEHGDGTRWHPWHGPLTRPYRFRYRTDRAYRLHSAATGLLYTDVLSPRILDWLSGYPDLWAALLYVLAGQYEHAGTLGELVVQADRASVAQALGGDPAKAREAPQYALQRKLLEGLRYLVREVLRLNQPEASDGWLTQDVLWLVSKTVCDRLRAHLLSQGTSGVPERNTTVFDVLQEHGIVQATPDGKAIWRATVTSGTGWTHSFTFLRLAPSLIWDHPAERPQSFSGAIQIESAEETSQSGQGEENATPTPASLSAPLSNAHPAQGPPESKDSVASIVALLQESRDVIPASAQEATATADEATTSRVKTRNLTTEHTYSTSLPTAAPDESRAAHFVEWLRSSLRTRHLIINDAKALVHIVSGTVFLVSPGIFQRYAREHPVGDALGNDGNSPDWQSVQKSFERLRAHKKQKSGHNIWTCEVVGPRRRRQLHGYLLLDVQSILDSIPADNPFLKLLATDSVSASTAI